MKSNPLSAIAPQNVNCSPGAGVVLADKLKLTLFNPKLVAPKAHLRSRQKNIVVSLRAVRVCLSVCLWLAANGFWSVATC